MKIVFLGGDKRMDYVRERFSADYDIVNSGADVVILPMPLTRDGESVFSAADHIPFECVADVAKRGGLVLAGGECRALTELCRQHSLQLVNYALDEQLTLCNAALTAENAVSVLIGATDGALLGSEVLITGYGRIAKQLAARLRAFGCEVNIAARRAESRCEAQLSGFAAVSPSEARLDYDFIVNTVPSRLFADSDFTEMGKSGNAVFLELATLPPLTPEFLEKYTDVRYIHGGGLPGKHSPRAAGSYIADTLVRILNERGEQS